MSAIAEQTAPFTRRDLPYEGAEPPPRGEPRPITRQKGKSGTGLSRATKGGGIVLLALGVLVGVWLFPEAWRYLHVRRM